jgi:uncharacterized protein (TIGR01319 family)
MPTRISAASRREANRMNALALLIDFGSTFTKVTAVNLEAQRVVGRAQAPSTAATDVSEGLFAALATLSRRRPGIFREPPTNLDALDGLFVRACSSAAGGLRIAVAGLVPGLTVAAANTAALSAGGKIVGTFGFKLADADVAEIERQRPDVVLLTGGTDGGDTSTIMHNAGVLARSRLSVPFVVAGNSSATAAIAKLLAAAGKEATGVANIMPATNTVQAQPVQDEIRRLFMQRIVQGKGIDKFQSRVPVLLPTPMAVLNAAILGSRGDEARSGCGDLLLVDVGGATTDVHSIGDGKPSESNIIPTGLPEPFAKRTVEGDLGIRCNAATILRRVGADRLLALFQEVFPEFATSRADLTGYIDHISADAGAVPREDWQSAADAILARGALDVAIERHVGRRETYYARTGAVMLQAGKDLTEVPTLIGTGGIFAHNPYAGRIMAGAAAADGAGGVLRPARARVRLDQDYVLYAVGLLSDSHPAAALALFEDHLRPDGRGPRSGQPDQGQPAGHAADHGHSCCS